MAIVPWPFLSSNERRDATSGMGELDRLGFQQLFNALPSPHMLLDTELKFVAANRAYEDVTERSEAELIGRYVFEAFPNEGEAGRRLQASLDRVLSTASADTLAYLEYDIPIPEEKGGGMTKRYWTAVHSPLCDATGQVIFILQNTVDITELVRLREAASVPSPLFSGAVALVQRAKEAEDARYEPDDQTKEFRSLFEDAPGMVALLQGPEHIFTFANKAYRSFVGARDLLGHPIRDVFPDMKGSQVIAMLDEVFASGRAATGWETRMVLTDPFDRRVRELFVDFSFHAIRNQNRDVTGIFVQGYDRSEAVKSQNRQRLLMDELNHRVKNTLSTVQSLARRSFRNTTDREEARRVFEARILALSNAHNLLSEQHWEAASLGAIAQMELSALAVDRFRVQGEPVLLNSKAAIALAMVMHELASNAVKYGALAHRAGNLSVRWRRDRDALVLEWNEMGPNLPEDVSELKPGFGMKMLERIVTSELEGRLDLESGSNSLSWTLSIPLQEIEQTAVEFDA